MKKTVKNRIARETLSRVLGHSVLSAVLVLGWNVSTVFAISPSSGIEQVIGVTNTVTAAPTYTITNDDYKAVLYARSTAGNVAALNVNGDVNVTYIQPTSSLHDNYGTLIFVTGTGTDLSSVKVDGDVNFNVSGLAYSDIWIESANTTIDIAGKLTGVSDSRNSVVMARQGTVNIGSVDVTVTSDPDNKNNVAIWLQDGATVNVAGEIKLDTQGQWGKGIWANGALGATTLTAGAIDIKTKVQAISVLNQSTVTVDGLVKVVKNSTSDSDVVGSSSGGSITAGSFDIVVNDALTNERALSAFGDDSTINCLGTAKIVINKNAGDTGSFVSAVLAGARGEITLGSLDAELDTKYSRGINVLSNNTDSKETLVTVNGAAKIMMKGEGSYGIIAQSGKSKIMLQDVQVTTTGNYSYGISSGGIVEANNVVLNGSGIQAFGVHAAGGDGTVILKNLWADMAGQASRGVYAQNGGSITADYVDIKTTGIGSAALAVTNIGTVIGTIQQSAITIGGGYVSSADSSSAALRLYSDADAGANNPVINLTNVQAEGVNGSRLILSSGFSTLNAASSILTGNVYANDTGTNGRFTFNMDASELNGSVFSSSSTVDIDLTMDNNSRWNIAGGVSVNNLHCLDNRNGIVDMSSKSNGYETLMIDSLKGTGTYIFDTDLSSEIYGDKISIVTSEVGNNLVQVKDASLINGEVTGVKNLLIITDASQNATFVGSALNSGGLWDVTPTIERGDVALDAVGNPVGTSSQWYLTKLRKAVNKDTEVLLKASDNSYALWRNTNDSLRKRLGDIRYRGNQDDSEGIWARYTGGKFDGSGFEASYNMYQLGYDKSENAKSTYGFAIDSGTSHADYSFGSGKDKLWSGSIYGTWNGERGEYTDIVARIGMFDTDINSFGDYPDKGSAKNHAYSLSVEYGKTIEMSEKRKTFIEPQIQFTLGRLGSSSYTTDRGTDVYLSGVNSYIGRVGVVAGKKGAVGNDFYLKANLLHEFGGDRDIKMAAANGETLSKSCDYGDTWFELGLGGNISMGKNSQFYGDIERSFGADIQKKWQINVGAQWSF